jgi:hypothetical protein
MSAVPNIERREDGRVIDLDTGEDLTPIEGFHVTDVKSAEWLMEQLSIKQAHKAALEARRDASAENFVRMIADVERDVKSMLYFHEKELEQVAKANAKPGVQTWRCPYGSVAWKNVPGKLKVKDEEEAVKWGIVNMPKAVKTTHEFRISALQGETLEYITRGLKNPLLFVQESKAFFISPSEERLYVKTGIDK